MDRTLVQETERNVGQLITSRTIAAHLDYTLLKPEATSKQIEQLCKEALTYDVASVCVNSRFAAQVSAILKKSNIKTCCVVGFPLGAVSTKAKIAETAIALEDGATEIDMVIALGPLIAGEIKAVHDDIYSVVKEAGKTAIVKVIIETCLLTDEQKITACKIAQEAGAAFVKTSTGFSAGGATIQDIQLMRSIVKDSMGVKASGGIRDFNTAMQMLQAGANRIGASSLLVMHETSNT